MEGQVKQNSEDKITSKRPRRLETRPIRTLPSPGKKFGLLFGGTVMSSLAIIVAGVHIGANGENRMYTGMVLWFAEFIQSL